jgi:hypothetical protein
MLLLRNNERRFLAYRALTVLAVNMVKYHTKGADMMVSNAATKWITKIMCKKSRDIARTVRWF